jgi:hypothetical protein
MLANIWEKVQQIWDFLNSPLPKISLPEDSFLARLWKFLASPMPRLTWGSTCEFIQTVMMILAMVCLVLYMMGARGKVAKCLYWNVALYVVLTILS